MKRKFVITHVLIIHVPEQFKNEAGQYNMTVHKVGELPSGFTLVPTWGDYFLAYKHNGKLETACSRDFFDHRWGRWNSWVYGKGVTPEQVIAMK